MHTEPYLKTTRINGRNLLWLFRDWNHTCNFADPKQELKFDPWKTHVFWEDFDHAFAQASSLEKLWVLLNRGAAGGCVDTWLPDSAPCLPRSTALITILFEAFVAESFVGFTKCLAEFRQIIFCWMKAWVYFSVTIVAIQYQSGSTIMLKILCPLPSSVWFLWVVCNSAILNHTRMILNLQFLVLNVFVRKILHLNCFIIFLG